MVAVSVGVGGLLSVAVKAGVVFEREHCSARSRSVWIRRAKSLLVKECR